MSCDRGLTRTNTHHTSLTIQLLCEGSDSPHRSNSHFHEHVCVARSLLTNIVVIAMLTFEVNTLETVALHPLAPSGN